VQQMAVIFKCGMYVLVFRACMQNTHVLLSAYATYSVYVCNPLKFVVGLRLGSRLVSGFALELGFCFHFCSLSYL